MADEAKWDEHIEMYNKQYTLAKVLVYFTICFTYVHALFTAFYAIPSHFCIFFFFFLNCIILSLLLCMHE